MFIPTPRLAVAVVLAGLAIALVGGAQLVAAVCLGGLALGVVCDAVWCARPRDLAARREIPERLSVGATGKVPVIVSSQSRAPVEVVVCDEAPLALDATPWRMRVVVPGGGEAAAEYTVTPPARGPYQFEGINLRWSGPLGLVARQKRVHAPEVGRVFPRYVDYSRYVLESRLKIRREGPQRHRIAQRAEEFESLRDYVPGDDTRRIDWKATARRDHLIVRNYEEERSKDVMVLVDAGRMMAPEADRLTKLDRAINAALMLASVAAERKDKVGLLVFADEPVAFLPPAAGRDQVKRFLDALYDVEVRLVEPSFATAFGYLKARHRKRSLVILLTDLIDPESSAQLLAHVSALTSQYLPLCITIRDQALEDAAVADIAGLDDIYRRAVAEQVLRDRNVALAHLRQRGVVVMDVAPDRLTVEAVNQYLRIRASGRV